MREDDYQLVAVDGARAEVGPADRSDLALVGICRVEGIVDFDRDNHFGAGVARGRCSRCSEGNGDGGKRSNARKSDPHSRLETGS